MDRRGRDGVAYPKGEGRKVPLQIYIAYGTTADQVTALRLQALGAVNGLAVYVPPAFTRLEPTGQPDAQSEARLRESEVVLGVVTLALSEACRKELNLGVEMGKRIIVLADPAQEKALARYFPLNLVVFDPSDPTKAEQRIVEFLRGWKLQQDAAKALLALGTIALGLMIFAPQD
jgi:hypothetical protein